MNRLLIALAAAFALSSGSLGAQAPFQPAPLIEPIASEHTTISWYVSAPAYGTPAEPTPAQIGWTALGSAAGLAVGVLAGVAAASLSGESFPSVSIIGGITGFAVGTVAAPVGAHLANGRRGSLPLGIAGSVVGTGGYYLLLMATRPPKPEWFMAGLPLVAIGVPTAIEIGTSD